ncbi:MAG: hypothetical protein WAS54_05695 [Scrofimicrobium sp.]
MVTVYLLERVTDQQYAILDGQLRHVPGGVDEHLRLRKQQATLPSPDAKSASSAGASRGEVAGGKSEARNGSAADHAEDPGACSPQNSASDGSAESGVHSQTKRVLGGAELRVLQKEIAATERKTDKLEVSIEKLHQKMADHDQTDFEGLSELTGELHRLVEEKDSLEEQWLTLSEQLP